MRASSCRLLLSEKAVKRRFENSAASCGKRFWHGLYAVAPRSPESFRGKLPSVIGRFRTVPSGRAQLRQLESVNKDWNRLIRASQIYPN